MFLKKEPVDATFIAAAAAEEVEMEATSKVTALTYAAAASETLHRTSDSKNTAEEKT